MLAPVSGDLLNERQSFELGGACLGYRAVAATRGELCVGRLSWSKRLPHVSSLFSSQVTLFVGRHASLTGDGEGAAEPRQPSTVDRSFASLHGIVGAPACALRPDR